MRQSPDLVAIARRRLTLLRTAQDTMAGKYDRQVVSLSQPLGDETVRQTPSPIVSLAYETGETDETYPREFAPRLLMMLWRKGVTVDNAPNGALRLVMPPYLSRLPAVLLAACRGYKAPLAAWMGADASLDLLVQEPALASPLAPLCAKCGTRRWWRFDHPDWICWGCEPPAVAGVEQTQP